MQYRQSVELKTRSLGPTGVVTLAPMPLTQGSPFRVEYLSPALRSVGDGRSIGMGRIFANSMGAFITALFLSLTAFALVPTVAGYHPVIVSSDSMEPALRRSDVVVLAKPGDDAVPAGTIVNFHAADRTTIHRVIEVDGSSYRTKGDANQSADSALVPHDSIDGTGVFLVPFVGLPPMWVDQRAWWKLAAADTLIGACGQIARRSWLLAPLQSGANGY